MATKTYVKAITKRTGNTYELHLYSPRYPKQSHYNMSYLNMKHLRDTWLRNA